MSRNRPKPSKNVQRGVYFNQFQAKTPNQYEFLRAIAENDVIIGHGVSGVGKTFLSIGLACEYLVQNKIKKILVCRSVIACDNEMGAYPGDVNEKVAPYMVPYLDYFKYFLGNDAVERLIHYGQILLYPVELLRGHTYDDTFMCLDEGQNCTVKQIKLFLTRMGKNSKAIIIGDTSQADISYNGLKFCTDKLINLNRLALCTFDKTDILRHPIIAHILDIFEKNGN